MTDTAVKERRAALREQMDRMGVVVTLYLVKPTGAYTKHKIEPFDFSQLGIGFKSPDALPKGGHCEFEVTFRDEHYHVIGKVVRCDKAEGGHSIGVLFDDLLPRGLDDEK